MGKWIVIVLVVAGIVVVGYLIFQKRVALYSQITSRGLNAAGGDITITNARIWTGDPDDPWKDSMTVRGGKIAAMNADDPAGRLIDAEGRLVVPGMWDGHCHPHAPYILTSPEAPTLFGAKTLEEVQDRLRTYVEEHPEDKFPRLFGWMSDILPEGRHPTRQMIDEVVSDRPVYMVHHGGHSHWVNTKALELAGALEHDPESLCGDGFIERDPESGLATGYMAETEYAATAGLLLNLVKQVKPYTFDEMVLIQRLILEEYSKAGVTSIWTKGGFIEITRVYEQILRDDALPVRCVLDNMYTPYSEMSDIRAYGERGQEIKQSDLPEDFLRADVIKIFIDLPVDGWIWMFEPYADGRGSSGKPAYPMEDFRAQMLEADKQGLQINISVYGDRALHECLNLLEETAGVNPARERRHVIEHAEYIQDADLPRFAELGVIASMNPIGSYPDKGFQDYLQKVMGAERLSALYQRYKDLLEDGALVVNGSDFPLAPMDPLVGIHLLAAGSGLDGEPKGGLWPHKQIGVEDALRTYTVNPAKAAYMEDRLGMLKPGFYGDFVILSDNILDPEFDIEQLMWTKTMLTVMNGHAVFEDFSADKKVIDFLK